MKKAVLLLMLVLSSGRCELPPGFSVEDWVFFKPGSGSAFVNGKIKTISGNWIELYAKDPRWPQLTIWYNTLVIEEVRRKEK
jgi:hypothetical protein